MGRRQLVVQHYDVHSRSFVVDTYAVEADRDEHGVLMLSVDGVRFGMAYDAKGQHDLVTTIQYPGMLQGAAQAYEIASRIWSSGSGWGAPYAMGAHLEPTK